MALIRGGVGRALSGWGAGNACDDGGGGDGGDGGDGELEEPTMTASISFSFSSSTTFLAAIFFFNQAHSLVRSLKSFWQNANKAAVSSTTMTARTMEVEVVWK